MYIEDSLTPDGLGYIIQLHNGIIEAGYKYNNQNKTMFFLNREDFTKRNSVRNNGVSDENDLFILNRMKQYQRELILTKIGI